MVNIAVLGIAEHRFESYQSERERKEVESKELHSRIMEKGREMLKRKD